MLKPEGLFGYDGDNVITHLELEAMLRQGRPRCKACRHDTVRRFPMRRANVLFTYLLYDSGKERNAAQGERSLPLR